MKRHILPGDFITTTIAVMHHIHRVVGSPSTLDVDTICAFEGHMELVFINCMLRLEEMCPF